MKAAPKVEPKAVQVWISETQSSKQIVVLAMYKRSEDGKFEFRTIGVNSHGLLGQGSKVCESKTLKLVKFPEPLTDVQEVSVGLNHFIVRADGKVYVWGAYMDSSDQPVWQPTEISFFADRKIISIKSDANWTCALVSEENQSDYFIVGKFAPLVKENKTKSFKDFPSTVKINPRFCLWKDQLFFNVQKSAISQEDLTDCKV